ncbi:MAG: hypothetical protein ABIJ65_02140 [Chloroflexota bacterium]
MTASKSAEKKFYKNTIERYQGIVDQVMQRKSKQQEKTELGILYGLNI